MNNEDNKKANQSNPRQVGVTNDGFSCRPKRGESNHRGNPNPANSQDHLSNGTPAPEDLGYPPDYNPYQAQKKRAKKCLKQLSDAQENLERMGACYQQFGEEERSHALALMVITLQEYQSALAHYFARYG